MAIGGLVLVVVSYVMPQRQLDEVEAMSAEWISGMERLSQDKMLMGWGRHIHGDRNMTAAMEYFEKNGLDFDILDATREQRLIVLGVLRYEEWMFVRTSELPSEGDKANLLRNPDFQNWMMESRGWNERRFQDWAENVQVEELQTLVAPTAAQAKELRDRSRQLQSTLMILWHLNDKRRQYEWMGWVGLCVGTLMTGVGFGFWYRLVQRHQDDLLVAQVREMEQKNRSMGESTTATITPTGRKPTEPKKSSKLHTPR
ncbi:MAG: hypothetical protein M3552_17580 [Planctomycetota bacterium]|nr:hypothetical protein [Planctomycetaceae bacterium]MDQ3332431.1 hypothetical protein [Planctomycetota bacterium]